MPPTCCWQAHAAEAVTDDEAQRLAELLHGRRAAIRKTVVPVGISSRRILAFDGASVSFRVRDYRRDEAGRPRVMTLSAPEFIRRFLLHVLLCGFHRIRHYGFLTGSNRKAGLAHIRTILGVPAPPRPSADAPDPQDSAGEARPPCPCCGGPMIDRRLLRGLASAPWAALPFPVEPGRFVMIRHGLTPPKTRRAALRGMPHRVSTARMSLANEGVEPWFVSPNPDDPAVREPPSRQTAKSAHRLSPTGNDAQPKSP